MVFRPPRLRRGVCCFRSACRVKGSDEALQAARLYLCTATRTVPENGLALFKVTVPESM